MAEFILGISTLLQFLAGGLAMRLVWITQRRAAWFLIATAVLLMAVRRSITLSRIFFSATEVRTDVVAELVALSISVMMVTGIALIAPYFRELVSSRASAQESEERLQAIIDNTAAVIYTKDTEGHYVLINRTYEEMLGINRHEVAGKTDFDLFPRATAESFRRNDIKVATLGVELQLDERAPRRDGSIRDYMSVKFPLRHRNGEIYAVCGISTDITDRLNSERKQRELEANILHTQKLESLGILAGGIAHDFNNLLVPILAAADLVGEDLDRQEGDTLANLENIRSAARRAADLCSKLLAYSGRGHFSVSVLDLSDCVRGSAPLLGMSAQGIALRYELADDLPSIEADETQIQQVIMNLVVNAAEAANGAHHDVLISTGSGHFTADELKANDLVGTPPAEGRYVWLSVRDTGTGMTDDVRLRLFEPFFTTKFTGRGLGLAAVLGIVRSHLGSITVESAPGMGTEVRVSLPASDRAVDRKDSSGAGKPAASAPLRGTILVVDDEEAVRNVARCALERAGFEVSVAEDGRRAIEVYSGQAGGFDAVLLDMTMPKMNGEMAFRELRALDPNVCVLMSSGYEESSTRAEHALDGLAGFLQKPYSTSGLLAAIREAMGQARPPAGDDFIPSQQAPKPPPQPTDSRWSSELGPRS
ncbi:MAG: two-component system cell cycle sensor histidine kinase/response regulator CckA [Chlamydiales bacterium]|jgi:two-component system cell cycle sensor histidine kinase/response regulator CckA